MRINVYAEELTDEVQLISKTVTDDDFGARTFYGIRVYLKSPSELHHSDEDDDRSAITFWGNTDQHLADMGTFLNSECMHLIHRGYQKDLNDNLT